MKRLLLSQLFLFFSLLLFAQKASLDWAYALGDTADDRIFAVEVDDLGQTYLFGRFKGSIDFDISPRQTIIDSGADESLFILKLDSTGNFLWVKSISASANGAAFNTDKTAMDIDPWGNVFLAARFTGTIDFDPGPGVFILQPPPHAQSIFVVKLDTQGNFLWARDTGRRRTNSSGHPRDLLMLVDSEGAVYTMGDFFGTLDMDPGPNVFEVTNPLSGYDQFFIQKLDSSGNFLWAKKLGSRVPAINSQNLKITCIDPLDNIILSGNFRGKLDADPGPDTSYLQSLGGDIFNIKLNSQGELVWANSIQSTQYIYDPQTTTDAFGNLFIAGAFHNADFDPGPDSLILNSQFPTRKDVFVLKLSPQGTFKWVKQFRRPIRNSYGMGTRHLRNDSQGNVYLAGNYRGNVDFDPGSEVYHIMGDDDRSYYILKLDTAGNFEWVNRIKHEEYDLIRDFELDSRDDIILAGSFNEQINVSLDFPPRYLKPAAQTYDMFFIKWGQDICHELQAIVEKASTISCTSQGILSGKAIGGLAPYTYLWKTDPYSWDSVSYPDTAGIYTFQVEDQRGCIDSSRILVSGPEVFGSTSLKVHIYESWVFTQEREKMLFLDAFNDGCIPSPGVVSLALDPLISFIEAEPAPDTVIRDTLIWFLDDLQFDSSHCIIQLKIKYETNYPFIARPCNYVEIREGENLYGPIADHKTRCVSLDEHDKSSYPQSPCAITYLDPAQAINYNIQFENGSKTVVSDVRLLDKLDPSLDLNTLRVNHHKFPTLLTEVLEDSSLLFHFDEVYLTDWLSNRFESFGYLGYEVRPYAGIPSGRLVENYARIFLDSVEIGMTDTVLRVLTDSIPVQDTIFHKIISCDSIEFAGRILRQSGRYSFFYGPWTSCDSLVVLDLTIGSLDTSIRRIGGSLIAEGPYHEDYPRIYQWIDCDDGSVLASGPNEQTFTPSQNGNYALRLFTIGCSNTSSCHYVGNVPIDQDFQNRLQYFPNPSQGLMEVHLGETYQQISIDIFDPMGQRIEKKQFSHLEKLMLYLPKATGLYLLHINADGKQAYLKVLKED